MNGSSENHNPFTIFLYTVFFVIWHCNASRGIYPLTDNLISEPLPLIEVGASKVRYRTHLRSLIFKFPPNMTIRQSLLL